MKNVKQYSVEFLQNLPSHLNIHRENRFKRNSRAGSFKCDYYWKPCHEKEKKALNIVRNSVGENMQLVYAKIKPLISGNVHYNNVEAWLYARILENYNDIHGCRYSNYYYVNPITNILCFRPSIKVKAYKQPRNWFNHYQMLTEEKARRKKRKKEITKWDVVLRMSKRPDLYTFYIDLINKQRGALNTIKNTRYKDDRNNKLYSLYKRLHEHDVLKARKLIDVIQPQIEALEAGQYNIFFESNAYLYNVQKECHHFEQP